jgi:hypothetical protein
MPHYRFSAKAFFFRLFFLSFLWFSFEFGVELRGIMALVVIFFRFYPCYRLCCCVVAVYDLGLGLGFGPELDLGLTPKATQSIDG